MTDHTITVDVSGMMDTPPMPQKMTLANLMEFSKQMPDPKAWIAAQRQNVRPWLIFLQTSNFKAPPSVPRLSRRIMRNIEYFQSNYVFVFLGLIVYCLITSPLLLIVIAAVFYCGYKLSQRNTERKFVLMGKELSLGQQYVIVAVCSTPILYLAGAHGAMFWVLGASFTLITLHAAFYNIEALMTNEDELGLLQEV